MLVLPLFFMMNCMHTTRYTDKKATGIHNEAIIEAGKHTDAYKGDPCQKACWSP